MIVKNYLSKVSLRFSNKIEKNVEAGNQRTCTPADFTAIWQDYQKQPPQVLHNKTILKNFAISTENTHVGLYFLKNCRPFRPATLLKRDPSTGVSL